MAQQARNDRTLDNVQDGQPREDTEQEANSTRSRSASMSSEEGPPPPLPPRPKTINLLDERPSTSSGGLQRSVSSNQSLPPQATTAVSLTDVNTQSFQDGTREVYASSAGRAFTGLKLRSKGSSNQLGNGKGSDTGDSMSVRSYALNSEPAAETESLFGDVLGTGQDNPQWDIRLGEEAAQRVLNIPTIEIDDAELDFEKEFSPVGELDSDGQNEEALLDSWKSKQKHFLILSAAGKPIYTRHGDDGVISSYIGILQTIISFYQGSDDPLKSFSAGEARFVVLSKGPLHLVAVSRLVESDAQLRLQLDALYMQILSTLTLPTLTHLFSIRPSTDLRRPLQGTETLLSSLADSFTRGSPPTLLSALECLKIRKAHRAVINNTLLKCRVDTLLYGLVVAGGRLVSVVRPKRHSLHPGDLQLIFNMVFEADGVKAGGGEPWIPICLPGFNNKGYLYMYVSFLELQEDKVKEINPNVETTAIKDDAVAILLISANKEGFFDLQKMKNSVVESLQKNGSMAVIKAAIQRGRPVTTDIIPGTVLRHFLYKSKANVQFTLPSYEPYYLTIPDRRRLLSIYHILHASVHAKNAHLKVNHCISRSTTSLAWVTPIFELYCVAGPSTSRSALAQSANKVVQWVQREEERLFIIGGAVF